MAKTQGKVNIPKEFKIKGKTWRVEYVWRLKHDDGEDCDGLCRPSDRTILLKHGLKDEKWITFLHEYVHAVLYEAHITAHEGGIDGIVEEVVCDAVADALDNNFTFRWKRQR